MSDKALLTRFDAWRSEGRTLVLATVVGTAGSTYTKAGQRMLIADSGDIVCQPSGGGDRRSSAVKGVTSIEPTSARLSGCTSAGESAVLPSGAAAGRPRYTAASRNETPRPA